jgi:hypothetical protein
VVAAPPTHGGAGPDAFTVGGTVHVPLHNRTGGDAVAAIAAAGITARAITSRPPTLDDVYLQFTGVSIAA